MPLRSLQELIFYHLEKRSGVEGARVIATKPDSTGMTPLYFLFKHQYQLAEPEHLIEGLNKIKLLQYAALGILDLYEEFAEDDYDLNELNLFAREFISEVVATFPFSCVDADWIRSLYESIEVLSVSRFFNEIIDPVNNDDDHDASCSTSTTGSQQHLSCTPHWTHPL